MKFHESEMIELKEIYTGDIKKEIVAFANTNGGVESETKGERGLREGGGEVSHEWSAPSTA